MRKTLIIREICNYFMLTNLKDRVIDGHFMIKERVMKGRFMTKDRVINPIFYSISSILANSQPLNCMIIL